MGFRVCGKGGANWSPMPACGTSHAVTVGVDALKVLLFMNSNPVYIGER